MQPTIGAVVAGLVIVTASCASSVTDNATLETTTPSSPAAESERTFSAPSTPPPSTDHPPGYVSRETWTDGPWPLTVDEAVVGCQGDSAVTITADGAEYALNAAAYAQTELPDAQAISIPDPAKPGFSLDVSTLIQRGLELCGTAAASTPSPPPRGGLNRPAGLVERETWPGRWPFTVDSATLLCQNGRVTVVAGDQMYALNGTAKGAKLWPPFDVIWLDDPKFPGMKVNIGPMLDYGLGLCD